MLDAVPLINIFWCPLPSLHPDSLQYLVVYNESNTVAYREYSEYQVSMSQFIAPFRQYDCYWRDREDRDSFPFNTQNQDHCKPPSLTMKTTAAPNKTFVIVPIVRYEMGHDEPPSSPSSHHLPPADEHSYSLQYWLDLGRNEEPFNNIGAVVVRVEDTKA